MNLPLYMQEMLKIMFIRCLYQSHFLIKKIKTEFILKYILKSFIKGVKIFNWPSLKQYFKV